MPIPNLILKTFASLAVSDARTSSVAKCKLSSVAFSNGDSITVSSMKSPRLESSSSPIGVSVEIGSLAILRTFLTCPQAYQALYSTLQELALFPYLASFDEKLC